MAIATSPSFPASPTPEANAHDLTRLLNRLEHTLLTPGADTTLRKSSYERTKVGNNVESARTILLRLEHDTAQTKASPQKTATQADLQRKRAQLKQLQNRLYELNQAADDSDAASSSDDDSDAEQLLRRYAPAVPHASTSLDITTSDRPALSPEHASTAAAAATLSSTLRSRRGGEPQPANTAATTGSSSTRPAPGANTTPFTPALTAAAGNGTSDALLAHHSSEQEALTTSLLTLATALKTSTKDFADTLAGSNPLVDRATAALDKSAGGMEAAGRKMGTLRRMSEGRSWWARLALYAWIAFLWVVAVVVVAVLPKLRF